MAAAHTLKAGILVVSDTAYADRSTDKAVPLLGGCFLNAGDGRSEWGMLTPKFVPDRVEAIQREIMKWCDREDDFANVIVTTGGTGFAQKDVTPEVCLVDIDKQYGLKITYATKRL